MVELLCVYGDKAYYWDELNALLVAVSVVAENVDYSDACEVLCERGIM